MTLALRVAAATGVLEDAGIAPAEAALDAELLARHVLGWDRARWVADRRHVLPDGFERAFAPLLARRQRREPLAYIRGEQEFYGRAFRVAPGVLIPRPESELLIEAAAALTAGLERPVILDLGTGSGCLAVTLALELAGRQPRLLATDISTGALEIARSNAAALDARVEFHHGPYLAGISGPLDLIVSNPPYIADGDREGLPPEIVAYEPVEALFAGADGLDVIRAILPEAAAALRPGAHLIFEMGWQHSSRIGSAVASAGSLDLMALIPDLQGIERIAVVRRRP